jgi:hypothetical protein
MVHYRGGRAAIDPAVYPDEEEFWAAGCGRWGAGRSTRPPTREGSPATCSEPRPRARAAGRSRPGTRTPRRRDDASTLSSSARRCEAEAYPQVAGRLTLQTSARTAPGDQAAGVASRARLNAGGSAHAGRVVRRRGTRSRR